MPTVLEGIRVIDLSHVLAGPTASMMLGDLGAEVIHVEPFEGDDAREFGPFVGKPGKNRSGYFISLNRNKKSLVLDLKKTAGKAVLHDLIKVSDIIIENFRPDTMEKLGFGWKQVHKFNPRMIYASISGFGHDTLPEYAGRPAYDMVAQAYSGFMSITGPPEGPPCRAGTSIGDIIAGHQAVIGILAALHYREKTGQGQFYDGSMVDGLFSVLENAVACYTIENKIPGPLGSAHPAITPFQAFATKDSAIITPIGNNLLWEKFCRAIGQKTLADDARFKNNALRNSNKDHLIPLLAKVIKKKSTARWTKIFSKANLPFSPINNLKDICEDPHITKRQMLVTIDQPGVGKMKISGSPIRLSKTPAKVFGPAPLLGEHSEQILKDVLSYSQEKIDQLKIKKVTHTLKPHFD